MSGRECHHTSFSRFRRCKGNLGVAILALDSIIFGLITRPQKLFNLGKVAMRN
jgi:hypothetical protein